MAKKIISWKTKGMNRDLSVSAFNPEFAFENRNLRLSTNEGNTLLSWVNERGTKPLDVHITCPGDNSRPSETALKGTPLGTAVINHQLIVFTLDASDLQCRIYSFQTGTDYDLEGKLLYEGKLDFQLKYPLETLASYESNDIQKVYWVDGYNQPRVINVAPSSWEKTWKNPISGFDFVPELALKEEVHVYRQSGGGEFPAGVIQYALTYYKKHLQESSIFHVTPLQYISYPDRGGSPDSKIATAFKIKVSGIDTNFDYLRIYSILRTSKNATPLVKRVADLPIPTATPYSPQQAKVRVLSSNGSNLDDFGKTMTVKLLETIAMITNDGVYTQGAAAYGKYLFQAYIGGKYIDVIDLETYERVTTLDIGTLSFEKYHGNVLSFGEGLAEGSPFPYLYYACENNKMPLIFVVKITHSGNTWDGSIVSRIYLPSSLGGRSQKDNSNYSSSFSHYFQNGCVDAENNCLWVSGYTQNSYNSNTGSYDGNQLVYRKYTLPAPSTSIVYLSSADVEKEFNLPFKKGTQGMVIQDGKLYQCFGYDSEDLYDEYLDCIDLETGKIVHSYNFPKGELLSNGAELESPYLYNGNIYLSATARDWKYFTLWEISFKTGDSGGSGGGSGGSGGIIVKPVDPVDPPEPEEPDTEDTLSFIDDGLHGETIDPTELLYKGGEEIKASTIEQKDGTLFLGNIVSTRPSITDIKKKLLAGTGATRENPIIQQGVWCTTSEGNTNNPRQLRKFYKASSGTFTYLNTLLSNGGEYRGASGFKYGEYYRLGVQFQYKTGQWSEPCWIGDIQQKYFPVSRESLTEDMVEEDSPYTYSQLVNTIRVPEFGMDNQFGLLKELYRRGYRKIRPVYAVPQPSDWTRLCQGIACPTMYRPIDRNRGNLYAQSSWLFRMSHSAGTAGAGSDGGGKVAFNTVLPSQYSVSVEGHTVSPYLRNTEIMGIFDAEHSFQIDDTLCTFHTPDLIFDTTLQSMDFSSCQIYYDGYVMFNKTYGDIDIQVSTPPIGADAAGFVHRNMVTDGYSALISGVYFNDYLVNDIDDGKNYEAYHTICPPVDFPVYMWHKNGSLNNDVSRTGRSAELLKKRISNYRFGVQTYEEDFYDPVSGNIQIFDSDQLSLLKIGGQVYMGNIDTLLTPTRTSPYYIIGSPLRLSVDTNFLSSSYFKIDTYDSGTKSGIWEFNDGWQEPKGDLAEVGNSVKGLGAWREPISMKYKSTPHFVIQFPESVWTVGTQYLSNTAGMVPLMEITKEYNKDTLFGGTSDEALQAATWIPCGPAVRFDEKGENVTLYWQWGDTYYQRYECLKTYPFTPEDKNQVVEIASFLCETRVNIDGRYDRNRGQVSNLNMTPQNFNLYNPVYSQKDNFFSYKILPEENYKDDSHTNTITWTQTKENGADVDLWTHLTLANTLELDGNKGEVTKLIRLNNQLIAFQDKGISQLLYNESTQVSTTEGVPIEITNSQKVQGKRYYSDTVGCSNKWSIATTPNGIYFMDSNEKSIYLFNGQLSNLSTAGGLNAWAKQNIPSIQQRWSPSSTYFNNFVAYYDRQNQEVLFINRETALAYSEKLNCFTSFYDYGGAPYLCCLDDMEIWLNPTSDTSGLWQHQAGSYCKFFDKNYPFSMTLVGNQEPKLDKIFTNLEFRACVEGEGSYDSQKDKYAPSLPFDTIEAWDEYQRGILSLKNQKGNQLFTHGTSEGALIRKFRIWRCDLPRDNAPIDSNREEPLGIKRFKKKPLDRLRNPWIYIQLTKNAVSKYDIMSKTEIHDIEATYFG